MKQSILDIALECKSIRNNKISLVENVIPRRDLGVVFTDYDINGDIGMYERSLRTLHDTIREKYSAIGEQLRNHINEYDSARIIHLSAIDAIVDCIIALEEKAHTGKRVFISHSSKDKEVVNAFANNILQLGIGIDYRDIFCTSIEELGVKNGEHIRKHIHENIKSADYSFLMISDNYKASEICLNEMGAVWAYDANVRLYVLPNSDFDKIGWLCDPQKADKINDDTALDTLFNEMTSYYSLPKDFEKWSGQRKTFLNNIAKSISNN